MLRRLVVLFLLTLSVPALAAAPVRVYRLANGMKLIVQRDRRAPVVVSQVWYKVGSTYEHDGITGISHMLEHMMFKGTPAYPAGEFSRIIAANGGSENAFTGRDYTAYFQQLSNSRLAIAFKLEADRMHNLSLPPKEFIKERQVVLEERRMRTDDNPDALTREQFFAAAYEASPNRTPVIGWQSDVAHLTDADVRRWYRRWYAPNNATLVVVGDVEPGKVLALARRYFGAIAPAKVVPPRSSVEPEQHGPRRVVVRAPAKLPYLLMGYKAPVLKGAARPWEPYALEVLAGVLDGGASARLSRDLVRGSQVAAAASASYDLYARLPSLFTLSAVPAGNHTVADLERALRQEIRQLRDVPVTAAELERVKTGVVANAVYERDSMFYQAMQIGITETVGLGRHVLDEYVKRIQAVTPEQVRAVARRYLVNDHLTVAVLQPLPLTAGRQPASAAAPARNLR